MEEGQWAVAEDCLAQRVILVTLGRGHAFQGVTSVNKELSPLVRGLFPWARSQAGCIESSKQSVFALNCDSIFFPLGPAWKQFECPMADAQAELPQLSFAAYACLIFCHHEAQHLILI